MMRRLAPRRVFALLYLLAIIPAGTVLVTGCGAPESDPPSTTADVEVDPDHDGHDHEGHDDDHTGHSHADNLPAALVELAELNTKIAEAAAAGDVSAAHDPLHEVFHVIELLPELAAKAGLDETSQQTIKDAGEKLLDAFGAVDEGLHGGEETGYADVENAIQEAMTTLTTQTAASETE